MPLLLTTSLLRPLLQMLRCQPVPQQGTVRLAPRQRPSRQRVFSRLTQVLVAGLLAAGVVLGGLAAPRAVAQSAPPEPQAPADGATVYAPVTLQAEPLPTLQLSDGQFTDTRYQYLFQVCADPRVWASGVESGVLADPEWTVPDGALETGATYYWRVQAQDTKGNATGWSNARPFTVSDGPGLIDVGPVPLIPLPQPALTEPPAHPGANTPGVERTARYTDYNAAGQVTEQENAYGQSFTFDYDPQGRLDQASTALHGEQLTVDYTYNDRGRLTQITDENGAVRQFAYDGLGRLSDVLNDAGAPVAEHAYHLTGPGGDVGSDPSYVRTTAPGGDAGHGDGTATPGQVTTHYVDGLGRAVQTHQHVGPSGALGSERIVAATAYDDLGREHKQHRPYRQSSSAFDAGGPTGRPATETRYYADPLGRPNEIDPPGAGVQERTYGVELTDLPGTLGAYRTQDAIDEEGNRTRTYTDGFGATVATVGDPLGIAATTRFTYNAAGDLTSVQKPEGDEVIYRYDAQGHLIYRYAPDQGTTLIRRDASGTWRFRQDAVQRAEGTVQYQCVDDLGRPTREGIAPLSDFGSGLTAEDVLSLDPAASCTEPSNATVRTAWRYGEEINGNASYIFPYDRAEGIDIGSVSVDHGFGRVAMIARRTSPMRAEDGTLADGTSAAAKWRVTTHSYDAEGRLAEKNIAAPDLGRTRIRYTYDRQGQLTKRSAMEYNIPSIFTQWYTYTPRGQVQAVYADTGTPWSQPSKPSVPEVTYAYTADGQVDETLYRNGLDEARTYDIRGRLAEIGDQQLFGETLYQQYDYRLNSQIDRVETYSGITAPGATRRFHYDYDYDALGRLTGADYFEGGFANATSSTAYDLSGVSYDQNGNLTALQRRDDSGTPVDALTYDYAFGTNRLMSLADTAGAAAGTAPDGALHDWDAGSGAFLHDNRGRMQAAPAPYHLARAEYTDDGLPHTLQPGVLLASQDYRQLSGPWQRGQFDNQYRTSDEARTGRHSWVVESAAGCDNGCPYMISANVTDEAAAHPGATVVFSAWVKAPAGHERPGIQLKYKAGGKWSYPAQDVYDADGSWQRLEVRLDLGTITDLQQVVPVARHTGSNGVPAYFDDLRVYAIGGSGDAPSGPEIRYRYSAGGQRTYTRIGTDSGTGVPTFTVRDGAAALGQLRGGASSDEDLSVDYWNILTPSGTPVGRFVDGSDSERRYYHTGHLGSIRAVTDPGGQVVERKDYYPFGLQMPGRTLTQGPPADEDFTGHELDPETGLHYAGARYYMSAIGRWTSTDPILGEKGPTELLQQDRRLLTMNAYNYTFNDPANLLDPDGRCPVCIGAGVGAVAGAAWSAGTELASQVQSGEGISASEIGSAALEGGAQGAVEGAITVAGGKVAQIWAGAAVGIVTAIGEGEDAAGIVTGAVEGAVGGLGPLGRMSKGNAPSGMQEAVGEVGRIVGDKGITTPGGEMINLLHDATRIATGGDEETLRSPVFKDNGDNNTEGGIQAPDHRTRDNRLDSGPTISLELRDDDQ